MGRLTPERRTRTDLIVTALIVVAVVAVGVVFWATSTARHSDLTPAEGTADVQLPAETVPRAVSVRWHAASSATAVPAVSRNLLVTADDGTVTARRPHDGDAFWTYRRDRALCATTAAWPGGDDTVISVYRNSAGCREVMSIRAADGIRHAARTSDADDVAHLSYDPNYALQWGPTRLETWGSNLVRGIAYGRESAPRAAGVAPDRTGCRIHSAVSGGDRVAVIERCDGDFGYRLSVMGASLTSEEKIREWGSALITTTASGPPPRLIAATDSAIAVYDGGTDRRADDSDPGPAVRLFASDAQPETQFPVVGAPGAPADSTPITDQGVVSYWTGSSTVVLDASSGRVVFQVPGALGPGSVMAGQLLVPVPGGISVRRVFDGHQEFVIPVDRAGSTGPVSLRVLGPYIAEQRGDQLVVLGDAAEAE
ncbi:hypothetical protein [Gordonia shandongensis]|uniref:Rv3212 family protein n=1 Tax=Gordonia shandongensis TaxID=376351 RepID=UPI00040A859D|nr:hypothetical protein [Gordonia shandongensis]